MKKIMRVASMPLAPLPAPSTEPELEFYLEDSGTHIALKVRDVRNGVESSNFIVSIAKSTGKLTRHAMVNKAYGLPLDDYGRVETAS